MQDPLFTKLWQGESFLFSSMVFLTYHIMFLVCYLMSHILRHGDTCLGGIPHRIPLLLLPGAHTLPGTPTQGPTVILRLVVFSGYRFGRG